MGRWYLVNIVKKQIEAARNSKSTNDDCHFAGLCDKCGKSFSMTESFGFGPHRVERKLGDFSIEITTGKGAWNNYDLCPECIINLLSTGREEQRGVHYYGDPPHTHTYYFIHPEEYTKRLLSEEIKLYYHDWDNTTHGSFK